MNAVRNLTTVLEDIVQALEPLTDEIPGLQVVGYLNSNPTPPAIDIYPADPFQEAAAFGVMPQVFFTVRARVSVADNQAQQALLLRMLDPSDVASVAAAIALEDIDPPLTPLEVSGFREYIDEGLLGCEWRVSTFL